MIKSENVEMKLHDSLFPLFAFSLSQHLFSVGTALKIIGYLHQ